MGDNQRPISSRTRSRKQTSGPSNKDLPVITQLALHCKPDKAAARSKWKIIEIDMCYCATIARECARGCADCLILNKIPYVVVMEKQSGIFSKVHWPLAILEKADGIVIMNANSSTAGEYNRNVGDMKSLAVVSYEVAAGTTPRLAFVLRRDKPIVEPLKGKLPIGADEIVVDMFANDDGGPMWPNMNILKLKY